MTASRETLRGWYEQATAHQRSHYLAANYYARLNRWLGIPVVVLTTAVGTSVFASLQAKPVVWIQILLGFASVLAAVLASLQTFLGFSDRAEQHRIAGAKYGAIKRELQELLASSRADSTESLSPIRERLDALAQESQPVPLAIFRRSRVSIREPAQGEAGSVAVAETKEQRSRE